jgi:hypothetical protein
MNPERKAHELANMRTPIQNGPAPLPIIKNDHERHSREVPNQST